MVCQESVVVSHVRTILSGGRGDFSSFSLCVLLDKLHSVALPLVFVLAAGLTAIRFYLADIDSNVANRLLNPQVLIKVYAIVLIKDLMKQMKSRDFEVKKLLGAPSAETI